LWRGIAKRKARHLVTDLPGKGGVEQQSAEKSKARRVQRKPIYDGPDMIKSQLGWKRPTKKMHHMQKGSETRGGPQKKRLSPAKKRRRSQGGKGGRTQLNRENQRKTTPGD